MVSYQLLEYCYCLIIIPTVVDVDVVDVYFGYIPTILILGDFNSETTENIMKEFCDTLKFESKIQPTTKTFLILALSM